MIATLGKETSAEQIYDQLKVMLADVVPDFELRMKSEIAAKVNQVKAEKNAVILGHNYMEPALFYSIPDFVGDSLDLARRAAQTDKDIIVFCGVKFMAETAKLLNPTKTVLIPSEKAGCSLAASITGEDTEYDGVSRYRCVSMQSADGKLIDICCTSQCRGGASR